MKDSAKLFQNFSLTIKFCMSAYLHFPYYKLNLNTCKKEMLLIG